MRKGKIGVFDSGFGGLTILKEIVRVLPQYDYVYLGDSARAPYGSRSQKEIYKFTKQGVEFLFKQGALIVILACNSASAEALRKLQHEYKDKKKVLGVIFPAAEEAVRKTKNKKIVVIGTEATIHSGAFKREISKLDPKTKIYEIATPLLAPIVEAGEDESESAKLLIRKYMSQVVKHGADTLILGCTHYSVLEKVIKNEVQKMNVISEGKVVGRKLYSYLVRHKDIKQRLFSRRGRKFFSTHPKEKFDDLASRFFGQKVASQKVKL